MGYIRLGIPEALVLKLVQSRRTPNFVETGTFNGGTSLWASKHFRKVVTIEINPELSRAVANSPACPKNIEFLVGNSAVLIADVVMQLDGPAVFWLDGHYCGPGTGDTSAECPIMDELAALRQAPGAIILIDDARCFFGPPPPPHNPLHWVNIDLIFRYFAEYFPNHTVTVHEDVIIAVPKSLKPVLDEDWLLHFDERFPTLPPKKPSLFRRLIRNVR